MSDIFISIITIGLKPLYNKNMSYYKIVKDFRKKLPRQQNKAKILTAEEIDNNPLLDNSFKFMTVFNMSTHKSYVVESELDLFYNVLNDFDYEFMFFKNYYKNYTRNINRFNPKAENGNFDLITLQEVLQNPKKPLKPYDVLLYHIKWEFKFTSLIYIYLKNRKKMDRH